MRDLKNIENRILFICEGNVGRSQMAEGFYNLYSKSQNSISAGINDVGAKYNYTPREDIIQAMKEKGVDISNQRIKQLKPELLIGINKIVVLCKKELLPSYISEANTEITFKEISDPFEANYKGVLIIRNQIEKVVLELINDLRV